MRYLIGAMLLALAAPAQAQVSAPDAATLDQLCGAGGMIGHAFGATGVPGAVDMSDPGLAPVALDGAPGGFEQARIMATTWSGKLIGIDYVADIRDEVDFNTYSTALAHHLAETGWQRRAEDWDPPIVMLGYAGEHAWFREVTGPDGSTELLLALNNDQEGFTLSCARADMLFAHGREVFGELPPGTPRPPVPALPIVPAPTVAACATPEVQSQIDRMLAGGGPGDFIAALSVGSRYRARLSTWKGWKLRQAGLSEDGLLEVLSNGGGDPQAALTMFGELMPILERLETAQHVGDRDGLCRGFVAMTGLFGRMSRAADAQWQQTDTALDAAAQRLGVSFD